MSVLQKERRLQCFFTILFMFFCISAGRRVDFLKLSNRKRRLFRIFSGEVFIKIWKLRFSLLQFCNDQPHLISPVSQMNITDHFVSFITQDSLYTLSDDRRTQMSYMQRFCHIRSAVIHHDRLWSLHLFNSQLFTRYHLIEKSRCKGWFYFQIDKPRIHCFCHFKTVFFLQSCHHVICDHDRCFFVSFCCCHCSVALVFTQIRTI